MTTWDLAWTQTHLAAEDPPLADHLGPARRTAGRKTTWWNPEQRAPRQRTPWRTTKQRPARQTADSGDPREQVAIDRVP